MQDTNKKQPRTEGDSNEGGSSDPGSLNTAPSPPSDQLPPVSDAPEVDTTTPGGSPPPGAAEEPKKTKKEILLERLEAKRKNDPKPERGTGIKVDELKNVTKMYEEGTQLKGWPEDEQDEVLYPFDRELNDKIYIWSVFSPL
jgi:hypothetical protein